MQNPWQSFLDGKERDKFNAQLMQSMRGWAVGWLEANARKGDKGDKGEQGERGFQGNRGERGSKGEKGNRGNDGLNGKQGLQGPQGLKGDIGKDGLDGLKGEKGARGERGQKGERSKDGLSAYEVAEANGFKGDVDAWLTSLKGTGGLNNAGGGSISRNKLLGGTANPTSRDGYDGEHWINHTTAEVFYKNDSGVWVSLGSIGSGSGGAVDSVNSYTGAVVLAKSDVGLGNADNTSDVNKPVSTATQTALDGKLTLPSLTNSSVLFSNGTTIAQDNSNFFWDDTNKRLGLGTVAPTGKLHITAGASESLGLRINMSKTSNGVYAIDFNRTATNVENAFNWSTAGAAKWFLGQDNDSTEDLILYSWESSKWLFKAYSSTGNLGFGNAFNQLYLNNASGNVSIGTTSSIAKLGVVGAGTTSATNSLVVHNSTGASNALIVRDDGLSIFGTSAISTPLAKVHIVQPAVGTVGLLIKAAVNNPTANLFEIQRASDSVSLFNIGYTAGTGNAYAFINGNMAIGGTAIATNALLTVAAGLTDPTATAYGTSTSRTLSLTATNSQSVVGGLFNISLSANAFNLTGSAFGGQFQVVSANSATVTGAYGGYFLLYNTGTGTITNGHAGFFTIQNLNAAGVVTNCYGSRVTVGFNNGTLTNTYGYYCGDITAGTQTNTPYSFYASDTTALNYFAGKTGFGGATTPAASAVVEISSTTQGLLLPRMTTTQKNAIASPAAGLMVYDTTLGKACIYGAAAWETITSI